MNGNTKAWFNRIGIIVVGVGLVMVKLGGGDVDQVASDIGGWIAIGGTAILGLWELGRTIIDRIRG